MLCRNCRTEVEAQSAVCPKCSGEVDRDDACDAVNDSKRAAGICAIMLGEFGVHKFVLGYTREGILMLLVTVLTFGYGAIITWPIAIVEGITYLRKSDDEFVRTYVTGKRRWF